MPASPQIQLLYSIAVHDARKRCLRLICRGSTIHHFTLGEEVLLGNFLDDCLVERLGALGDQMLRAYRLAHNVCTTDQVSILGPLAFLHKVGRALCITRWNF